MAEKTEKGREFLAGMRAGIPIVLGYIPVAVAYAVMARQAGFTAAETAAMSVAVYAGASQMMATEMYAQGAGISVIILAALIMNLRHVVMSTCVVSRLQKTRPAMRLLLAFGVTDETFALFTAGAAGWPRRFSPGGNAPSWCACLRRLRRSFCASGSCRDALRQSCAETLAILRALYYTVTERAAFLSLCGKD